MGVLNHSWPATQSWKNQYTQGLKTNGQWFHGRFEWNVSEAILRLSLVFMAEVSHEIVPWWISLDLTVDKSKLVHVITWCRHELEVQNRGWKMFEGVVVICWLVFWKQLYRPLWFYYHFKLINQTTSIYYFHEHCEKAFHQSVWGSNRVVLNIYIVAWSNGNIFPVTGH